MKITLLLAALCLPLWSLTQTVDWIEKSDEELAIQFYQQGEYEKARALFEDLLKKDENRHLNDYYLNCLLKLEAYGDAEKFLKKELKKSDKPLIVEVDLGYVYMLSLDDKNAEKAFDDVLRNLPNDEIGVQAVASAFQRRKLDKYAVKAYLEGRRKAGSDYFFAKPLAEIYGEEGEINLMVDEYVKYALYNYGVDEEVKSALAGYLENDSYYDIIKANLIKKTQDEPENELYVDLLSWMFVSKKEFFAAYVQLKGLDKRLEENGARLFELAKVCYQNKEYRVAEQSFQYILDLGSRSPYYYQAKLGFINMKYTRVTETTEYTQDDLLQLQADYKAFVNDPYIPVNEKYRAYLHLAEIQALYLNNLDDAIEELNELAENPRIPHVMRGEAKLQLADYLLMRGDLWDAKLKYWQVEKDFKDNPLAHRAKFMKAKISFYTGEFELAQTFLGVLKGSTSELISNDALQLSMLIQDNLGLDTISTPLELYAKADKLLFMNRLDDAEKTLDTILEFFPRHNLDDEIYLLKGDIEAKKRNYAEALKNYEKVYTAYAHDILADDALYKAANIYQYKSGDYRSAYKLLEKLVLEYQSSVFSVDARNRFRALREQYPDIENEPAEENETP